MTVFTQSSISAEAAEQLISRASSKAKEMGVPAVIAISDTSGVLKAFLRMDGAALGPVQMAQDKAYTAAAFTLSTDQWYQMMKADEVLLHGMPHAQRMVIMGGGIPLVHDGVLIGGIGVSGGHYSQDMEIAKAALEALGTAG